MFYSQNLPPIRDVFPEDLYNFHGTLGSQNTGYMISPSPTFTNTSEETHSLYTWIPRRQSSVSATDVGISGGRKGSVSKRPNPSDPRRAKAATKSRRHSNASASSAEKKSKERASRSKQQIVLEKGEDAASIICGWYEL